MGRLFTQLLRETTPKVNDDVMSGIAELHMKGFESYLDTAFRSIAQSFPEGLTYEGYAVCSPQEEYDQTTRAYVSKRTFELAKSDLYLIKFFLKWQGQLLAPRYLYLLYVEEGAMFRISGARFHLTPVICDRVISPSNDAIFVKLLKDRINFRRCVHNVIIDDEVQAQRVVWAKLYDHSAKNTAVGKTTKAFTSLTHYLLAKYGFEAMFRLYTGVVPVVQSMADKIDRKKYPAANWVVIESTNIRPVTYVGKMYPAPEIRLLVPKQHWTVLMKGLVFGFFYVVDHFPSRLKPVMEELNSTYYWMILLGHILFSGEIGENKLYTSISEHMSSLDSNMDTVSRQQLQTNGCKVESFYDLLAYIVEHFNELSLNSDRTSLSMYTKTLEVLSYVAYTLTKPLVETNFALLKQLAKRQSSMQPSSGPKRTLTADDVRNVFNKRMTPGKIYNLITSPAVCEGVSYSGDHKYMKVTSKVTAQESYPGKTGRKSRTRRLGPSHYLDSSMVFAGSLLFLPKKLPTPMSHLNPYALIDRDTHRILQNPEFTKLEEVTAAMYRISGEEGDDDTALVDRDLVGVTDEEEEEEVFDDDDTLSFETS